MSVILYDDTPKSKLYYEYVKEVFDLYQYKYEKYIYSSSISNDDFKDYIQGYDEEGLNIVNLLSNEYSEKLNKIEINDAVVYESPLYIPKEDSKIKNHYHLVSYNGTDMKYYEYQLYINYILEKLC